MILGRLEMCRQQAGVNVWASVCAEEQQIHTQQLRSHQAKCPFDLPQCFSTGLILITAGKCYKIMKKMFMKCPEGVAGLTMIQTNF